MAAGTINAVGDVPNSDLNRSMIPVSRQTNWKAVCTDPTTTDNATSTIVAATAITRSAQNWLLLNHAGTTVQFCLRYVTGSTLSVNPVIQAIGQDINGVPQNLLDSSGNSNWTLTPAATDQQDVSGFSYTAYIEVDAQANAQVLAAIKTASAGAGTGAAIMARVK